MSKFSEAAVRACTEQLGVPVLRVEHPAGSLRKSIRMRLEGRSVIATRRRSTQRALLEYEVLRALHSRGAAVPRPLAFDGTWLIQEDLSGVRLSQALQGATEAETELHLSSALESLALIHRLGKKAALHKKVAAIGQKPNWVPSFIATPKRIGNVLALPAPSLPVAELTNFLTPISMSFIKWDARPGNAAVQPDGSVSWFDWEHSGCRHSLDDVAWLLGDDYVPDWPTVEDRLLDKYLPKFCDIRHQTHAYRYFKVFGTFHISVRLALIIDKKGEGAWWDPDYCVSRDKVGVTLASAQALCTRAGRWSEANPLTENLSPWFAEVSRRLAETV